MISKRRVRLMARLAICEKEKGQDLKKSGDYFRGDYIGIHLIRNFFRATAAFLIGAALWVLLCMDYVVEKLGVLDVAGMGLGLLAWYGILTGGYLLVTYVVYAVRYRRSEKAREEYNQLLLNLEREYSRDSRRVSRAVRPEGDGR